MFWQGPEQFQFVQALSQDDECLDFPTLDQFSSRGTCGTVFGTNILTIYHIFTILDSTTTAVSVPFNCENKGRKIRTFVETEM